MNVFYLLKLVYNCYHNVEKHSPNDQFISNMSGSRRPSIASVHSASSIRSYSARRYEKERQQKEEREMRLAKVSRGNSSNRVAPTPSPHSTDDLLPTLEEDKQVSSNCAVNNFFLFNLQLSY